MWIASLTAYEKLVSRANRNDKRYFAILVHAETREIRTSKVAHKTVTDVMEYSKKFNSRCRRELMRPYEKHMRAGDYPFHWSWASIRNWLRGFSRLDLRSILSFMIVLLVDVSRWQGLIDYTKMISSPKNVRGVIPKISQGTVLDIQFANNWRNIESAGLPRGGYHYYDSRVDPKAQALTFWSAIRNDPPELMLAADYEETYGGPYAGHRNLRIFLEELMRLSGYPASRILIYTGYYYWLAHSPTNTTELNWFKQFPLWLAWYTADPSVVRIPKPWDDGDLLLWQSGTPVWGRELGAQSEEIDVNYFYGTEEKFNDVFNLDGNNPPNNGGEMYYELKPLGNYDVRVRAAHAISHIQGTGIGTINNGSTGKASEKYEYPSDRYDGDGILRARAGDIWWHVTEANGQTIDGWSAQRHMGVNYLQVTQVNPPATSHTIDVIVDGENVFHMDLA